MGKSCSVAYSPASVPLLRPWAVTVFLSVRDILSSDLASNACTIPRLEVCGCTHLTAFSTMAKSFLMTFMCTNIDVVTTIFRAAMHNAIGVEDVAEFAQDPLPTLTLNARRLQCPVVMFVASALLAIIGMIRASRVPPRPSHWCAQKDLLAFSALRFSDRSAFQVFFGSSY